MNAGKKELLCSKCRKRVSYHIYKTPAKVKMKDVEVEYEEYYGECDECHSRLFVPGLDDRNEEVIENTFRKEKGLITIAEINKILEKYNVDKRPLSKMLGFGDLTITRYMDGQLPSAKYSAVLFDILKDEQKMREYVDINREEVSAVAVNKVLRAIEKIEQEKTYNNSAEKVALYLINSGKGITNLMLQKLLYYTKGISKIFEDKSIILEPCEAWKYGPVFPSVYEKYRNFGKEEIEIDLDREYVEQLLNEREKKVVDYVLDTFGIYNAWFLKDLTHLEEPWIVARGAIGDDDASNIPMDESVISEYFARMDKKYNLKEKAGVDSYIDEMRKKMK